ncbi:GNAT family N-acetyltransferase [Atopomonas sediminilitoris]|uniref:GNAT family N-acetyltransferase n=1 Tax=Atopomonas sediminilitoris TaxID=2919919 RepID=UPI001F4E9FFF|nr:GNAT family N-acetyltransferase [Atopomonas sediminilitoris]MCJ8169463.1 GNAT family N-acetyltransferase [Atopomonas sediminilitoris]
MPTPHSTITLRPATEADLASICNFAQSAEELFYFFPRAHYPLTVAQLAAAMASRQGAHVACVEGAVVGYANFFAVQPNAYASLGNLVIAPQARGQGVARALIDHLGQLAAQQFAATELRANCFNHNTQGLLVYRRLGFSPFALEPREDWQGQPVMLIQLRRALRI